MRKIFVLQDKDIQSNSISTWTRELATAFKHETDSISADKNTSADDFAKHLEDEDASLLIIELNDKKHIQQYLNLCRGLRVPWIGMDLRLISEVLEHGDDLVPGPGVCLGVKDTVEFVGEGVDQLPLPLPALQGPQDHMVDAMPPAAQLTVRARPCVCSATFKCLFL